MTTDRRPCDSIGYVSGMVARTLLGIAFLFLGVIMIITFWLLPLGIPVALFGLAMIVADNAQARSNTARQEASAKEEPSPSRSVLKWFTSYLKKYCKTTTHKWLMNEQQGSGDHAHAPDVGVTNLQGAVLQRADLSYVDLRDCILIDTDLSGAKLHRTNLCGADLRHVRGLTADQLAEAVIDKGTQMPEYLSHVV